MEFFIRDENGNEIPIREISAVDTQGHIVVLESTLLMSSREYSRLMRRLSEDLGCTVVILPAQMHVAAVLRRDNNDKE